MSGLMARFFANLLPYFSLLWSIDLLLFFRTIYIDIFIVTNFSKILPPLAAVLFTIFLILLPIRTFINRCSEDINSKEKRTYDELFVDFTSDYDRENPVTKNEGMMRIMEKKIQSAKNEEEREKLK